MLQKIIKPFIQFLPENNRLERIWILSKFDFKSRFYYHNLGILWALIRPIFQFVIFYIVFTQVLESDVENFALYLFLSLIFWDLLVEGTSKGLNVLREKIYILENVPFTRTDLFISSTLSAFYAFTFNFLVYVILSFIWGAPPLSSFSILGIFVLLLFFIFILGLSFILSTISIFFKDIHHLWDMIIMAGFWATPVLYSAERIEEFAPILLYINPITPFIICFRQSILYQNSPDSIFIVLSISFSLVTYLLGYYVFSKFSYFAAEKI